MALTFAEASEAIDTQYATRWDTRPSPDPDLPGPAGPSRPPPGQTNHQSLIRYWGASARLQIGGLKYAAADAVGVALHLDGWGGTEPQDWRVFIGASPAEANYAETLVQVLSWGRCMDEADARALVGERFLNVIGELPYRR